MHCTIVRIRKSRTAISSSHIDNYIDDVFNSMNNEYFEMTNTPLIVFFSKKLLFYGTGHVFCQALLSVWFQLNWVHK